MLRSVGPIHEFPLVALHIGEGAQHPVDTSLKIM